jgi:hypothetical protein
VSKTPKPILHRRDHEHGGADPVRIQWEQTGDAGGGSLLTNAGVYTGSATTSGGGHTFPWAHSVGNTPLDLSSDSYSPTVFTTGVYSFACEVVWAGDMPSLIAPTYTGPPWFQTYLVLDSGADGVATAGANQVVWQVDHSVGTPAVVAGLCCTWYLPVGATSYAFITAPDTYTFNFEAFVQQVA